MKTKTINRVTKGVDPARIQMNKPSFFVEWEDISGSHIQFFSVCSSMYNLYDQLKTLIK